MKQKILFFITISFLSCFSSFGQLAGSYKSAEYNYLERGFLYLSGIESFIGGMELSLSSDSSFCLKTCSVMETGNWSIVNDSLYLDIITRKSRADSINSAGEEIDWLKKPYRPKIYEIINDGFYRVIYLRDDKKIYKSADKLVRDDDK
jgi:hypothetical protein